MSENQAPPTGKPPDEGGLRAPPELSRRGKVWWWFHFVILVNLARLRFIAILVAIGLVIVYWDTLLAFYDKWTRPAGAQMSAAFPFEYYCPMHPTVVRDNPKEKCPICQMPLSKRRKGVPGEALPPGIVNRVQLSPYRVVLAGIQTSPVSYVPLTKEITTVGTVEFDERELKNVSARVKGRLDRLFVSETGTMVHVGQELASLYSPDLVVTLQNLLDARRGGNKSLEDSARDRLRQWGIKDKEINRAVGVQNLIDGFLHSDQTLLDQGNKQLQKIKKPDLADALTDLLKGQKTKNEKLTKVAKQRLIKLGMHQDQIDDIVQTGNSVKHLIIRSPIFGHVLKKYVKEGQYVDEGSPLYDVVDLSTVWIQAQVYEEDMVFLPVYHTPLKKEEAVKIGLPMTAVTRAGQVFSGNLTFVFPHVDQETRTVTARFELKNPEHELRPGATATVKLKIPPNKLPLFEKTFTDDWMWGVALGTIGPQSTAGLAPFLRTALNKLLLDKGFVLAVPDSAVIDTGTLQIVYREVMPGEFEGVRVELGPRMQDPRGETYYPVLHGLQADDAVVTAGSFLLDAETRLNPAAGSIYFGGSGGKSDGGPSTVRPSTPEDEEAKIKFALDKLSGADRQLAQEQKTCPVMKNQLLGSMGVPVKLMIQGQPVFLCCKNCERGALANPARTLKEVARLKAQAKGK
jgi:Cu(I)/Ag(I) efflux system membrane fusion protein